MTDNTEPLPPPSAKETTSMTTDNDALVRTMAERFLSWKLPENFNPDGGIKFDRVVNLGTLHQYYHEPTGTNLLDFTQAKQMIEYLLAGLDLTTPHPKPLDPPAQDEVEAVARAIHEHLCRRDIMQYLDNDEDCTGLATAAITALRQHQSAEIEALRAENARFRGALGEVRDKWVSNNSEGDDYEEGYDDGLNACHDIARAALEGGAK